MSSSLHEEIFSHPGVSVIFFLTAPELAAHPFTFFWGGLVWTSLCLPGPLPHTASPSWWGWGCIGHPYSSRMPLVPMVCKDDTHAGGPAFGDPVSGGRGHRFLIYRCQESNLDICTCGSAFLFFTFLLLQSDDSWATLRPNLFCVPKTLRSSFRLRVIQLAVDSSPHVKHREVKCKSPFKHIEKFASKRCGLKGLV